jgi:hypothetical protein
VITVTIACDHPGCEERAECAQPGITTERRRLGSVYRLDMWQDVPAGWTSHYEEGERCPTHAATKEGE